MLEINCSEILTTVEEIIFIPAHRYSVGSELVETLFWMDLFYKNVDESL